ncbi:chorismate-binding protein [Rhodoflexus sp.]
MLPEPHIEIAASVDLSAEINYLLTYISSESRPFALWKMPERNRIDLIAGFATEAQRYEQVDLETLPPGFAAAPFDTSKGIFFIPADQHWTWEADSKSDQIQRSRGTVIVPVNETSTAKVSMRQLHSYIAPTQVTGNSADSFRSAVRSAIEAIRRQEFQKVVLSRQKEAMMPKDFNPVNVFMELCRRYPTAYISFFAIPQAGVWMGATPEILVSVDSHQIFRTMALAGTQAKGAFDNLQQASWTQKEIAEQAMVSRYIINCFKKIRLREFEENGPRTVAAGHLIHLRTDFEVDMQATNFPQLGTVMLSLLHPTSAVCGMPKEPATNFIYRHENYDRSMYSGYIGSVNMDNESHLFVNLRCMQLQERSLIMYAGAGITEDSDPEKEWHETELKCNTMLSLIRTTDTQ